MKQIAISTINERATQMGVDYLTDAEALSAITGISIAVLQDMIEAYNYHGLIRHVDTLELIR